MWRPPWNWVKKPGITSASDPAARLHSGFAPAFMPESWLMLAITSVIRAGEGYTALGARTSHPWRRYLGGKARSDGAVSEPAYGRVRIHLRATAWYARRRARPASSCHGDPGRVHASRSAPSRSAISATVPDVPCRHRADFNPRSPSSPLMCVDDLLGKTCLLRACVGRLRGGTPIGAGSPAGHPPRQRKTLVQYVLLDVGTRVDRSPRCHPDCRHALSATASQSSVAAGGLLRRTCD